MDSFPKRAHGLDALKLQVNHHIHVVAIICKLGKYFQKAAHFVDSRHDTIERSAYMPGVLLTLRRVRTLQGLVYGLERLL